MLQVVVKKGKIFNETVPSPNVSKGSVLIKVLYSCISAGTEIATVNASGKNLIKKALEQPQNIKKAINFAKSEGIASALTKIQASQSVSTPLGYSLAGEVVAIGEGVQGYEVGDVVAAAGAGIANHAEYVDVPVNLVMKCPNGLRPEYASTVTLGGIALQGVRRLDLRLGESAVVMGAGILGLLALQMLKVSGVRVIVIDLDDSRLEIAKTLGADLVINARELNLINDVLNFSKGYGVDGVLFTAATSSNEPLSQSFRMCKRKGRVVLVGVAGSEVKRDDMYEKELDFLISTSYGPGRYDPNYEQRGIDYPYAYVRWTENRNMEEYLRLLQENKINLDQMINAIFAIENVDQAFSSLRNPEKKPLIVLLKYDENKAFEENKKYHLNHTDNKSDKIRVGLIGAGSFAEAVHLPNLIKLKKTFEIAAISSRNGLKAKITAEKFGAKWFTNNAEEIINDPNIDLVIISTRHDSHASYVIKCLKAGKHVFVEKPLAINETQVGEIEQFYMENRSEKKPKLFVGFNRRFSKFAIEIKKQLEQRNGPLVATYRMNAGFFNADHWIHMDGGRIIGEACHIIDLAKFLVNEEVRSISVESIDTGNGMYAKSDNKIITIKYSRGSLFNILYLSNGSSELEKEFLELHFDGKSIQLEDYKSLKFYGIKKDNVNLEKTDKGHLDELEAVAQSILLKKNDLPIKLEDLLETSRISILAAE